MLDYLNSFQIFASCYVIVVVGVIFGKVKMFDPKALKAIRRLIYLIPIPAMMFNEIGNSKINGDTWIIFAHQLLIQIVLHILVLIYSYLYHGEMTVMQKFIVSSIAFCETDLYFYSYALCQVLFVTTDIPYSVVSVFVQFLIVNPFHAILAMFFIPHAVDLMNKGDTDSSEEVPLDPKEHNEEEDELEDKVEDSAKDGSSKEPSVDQAGNPSSPQSEDTSNSRETITNDSQPKLEDTSENHEKTPEDVPVVKEETKKQKKPWTRTQLIIYRLVNQHTICAVLGIIWSAIGIEMPIFLASFVEDLENATIASSFFLAGLAIAFHPFFGVPIVDTIIGCVFHVIIGPLLSIAFSYALGIENSVATLLIFSNMCPTSIYGLMLSLDLGMQNSIVSYTYYWSHLIMLPIMLIWTAIINSTGLFGN